MQSRKIIIQILALFSLFTVAACDSETRNDAQILEAKVGAESHEASDPAAPVPPSPGSEIVLTASPSPLPTVTLPPPSVPSPSPSPAQNPSNPTAPTTPGSGIWGSHLEVEANHVGFESEVSVAVANPQTQRFATFDQTLALGKVFNVPPLLGQLGNGPIHELDPLGRIQPQEAGASAHFYRASPILAGAENYLEVQFSVIYPHRFQYNPASGYYESFFPANWLEFELWACQTSGSCRTVEANIPSRVAGPQPCFRDAPSCEKTFSAKVEAARLPSGGVEHSDYYKIVVKGTAAADYLDENGYPRLCSNSELDCTMSHPYCVAGVCSAVTRAADYYRVETPQALRELR